MDNSLTPDERRRFHAWVYSPSVSSSNRDELIIAFKLSKILSYPGSRVLKALRGIPGLDAAMVRTVEDFVMNDASLAFTGEPPARMVRLTGNSRP
jgi:hypothetical protein